MTFYTEEQEYMLNETFLRILKSALQGEKYSENLNLSHKEWKNLLELAQAHRLLPLIFDCIYDSCPFDEENQKRLRSHIKQLVTTQTLNTQRFLELYDTLTSQGVKPIIVKGIICRSTYPKGDLRISGDEDMLISPEEYEKCQSILSAEGFSTVQKDTDKYQISYYSADGLHIELHKSLFDDKHKLFSRYNQTLKNCAGRAVYINIEGVSLKTLSPTDNLLYLILHALKHFLHSGVGIRQVCDIILFANRYGQDIDWIFLFDTLKTLSADKFALGLFTIGKNHLGFPAKIHPGLSFFVDSEVSDTSALLEDIMSAGVYGSATMGRQHSASITMNAAQGKKESLLRRAFPPLSSLDTRYNYAKKIPLLLPIAWIHRLLRYKKETKHTLHNSPRATMSIGKKRMELLKSYNLIP